MNDYENDTNKLKNNIRHLLQLKELDQAKTLLDKYENTMPQEPEFYVLRALLSIQSGHYDDAWLWLWRGIEKYPDHPDLHFHMGFVCECLNKYQDTLLHYRYTKNLTNDKNLKDKMDIKISEVHAKLKESSANEAKPLRVLQGTMEIANQMNVLSKGLQSLGILSKTLSYYDFYLGYSSDYTWNLAKEQNDKNLNARLKKLTNKLMSQYNIFHFHFGTTLTLDRTDLEMLNRANKSLFMQHWGSEVRFYSQARKLNPYAKAKVMNEESIKYRLERLSRHIRHCFVADRELHEYVKNFYENVYIIPSMIDLSMYQPEENTTLHPKPLIVHAPTSQEIKGTKYILQAVEHLKSHYEFDFQLVHGMSHKEAMEIYRKADIIIDQLHIGSYGLFAVECMAMGKPVICWISDYMQDNYPEDLPIISANPDNVVNKLEYVLQNQDMLPEIGRQGRKYVERYHDMLTNSKKTLRIYEAVESLS